MGISNFTNTNKSSGNSTSGSGAGSNIGLPPLSQQSKPGGVNDPSDMMIDYNTRFAQSDPTLFRDQVTHQTMSILIGKLKPNALLIGPAGVGKTKIVEDIARRIATNDPSVPSGLRNSTIWEMPLSNLMAGAGIVGELEQRITQIIDFATDPANNVVLFIDEIHLISNSQDSTYNKIAQILKPALARGDMRVIGATTSQEARDIESDPAFARRFSRVIVDELTHEQTTHILEMTRASFVTHYKNSVSITDKLLPKVVSIADQKKRAGQHRPDNALTLLDRAMADAVMQHKVEIERARQAGDIGLVNALTAIGVIPVTQRRLEETANRLMTGSATPHELDGQQLVDTLARIKGQDNVMADLSDALIRDALGIFPRSLPLVWLFAGASGCGKTETAKIIAEEVTHEPAIVLNMTEYTGEASLNRIVGSPEGYVDSKSNNEKPFDILESNPHRVIILDEFEKAHKSVQRLFLSAFDEGYVKTARGKIIDFSKSLIIATTNAARDSIGKPKVGFDAGNESSHLALVKQLEGWFDAELLGRFTKIVAFNNLSKNIYRDVLIDNYARERAYINEKKPHVANLLPVTLPDDELDRMINETYISSQGARPANKAVKAWIETAVLNAQRAHANSNIVPQAQRIVTTKKDDDDDDDTHIDSHTNDTNDT